jgi:hypothetical protein
MTWSAETQQQQQNLPSTDMFTMSQPSQKLKLKEEYFGFIFWHYPCIWPQRMVIALIRHVTPDLPNL